MKTIKDLVYAVHGSVVQMGAEISPAGVGTIIGLFLEGLAAHQDPGTPRNTAFDEWLRKIADECNSVKDEE